MEQEQLSLSPSVKQLTVYWEMDAKPERSWETCLHRTLEGVKRLAIDPFADAGLTGALSDYDWRLSEMVEDLRVIKSPAEVGLIRKVAGYWNQAMNNMLNIVSANLPIGALMETGATIADHVFANEPNASWINTDIIQFFQCAPASSSPHHLSYRADETLPHGPTILNAVGGVCEYHAENERTVLVGDYTAEHAELFDIYLKAHELALSLIKPGVPCAAVDSAVQDYFNEQGLGDCLRHRIGHGFGIKAHERPYSSEGSEETYQPNMVISVEPGLYVNGVGGYRHCDTVLITEDGIENFSLATPKDRNSLTF